MPSNGSNDLLTMTLDSNVVLDAFERGDQTAGALIALHPDKVRLQIASRTPEREATLHAAELRRLALPERQNLFRLDISTLDGPDGLASDADAELARELQEPIFPSGVHGAGGEIRLGRLVDVDVSHAHLKSEADYLITSDRDLLGAAERLRDRFGIKVITPSAALRLVTADEADPRQLADARSHCPPDGLAVSAS